jgi:GH35 family endo-1,4-beta-xylanase
LFNYATLPFYWGSYEKTQGHTAVQRLTEMATWCRDHHIIVKGHPLVYALSYPGWAPKDAAGVIPLLQGRVTDLITRYDGLINIWDVVNEAITTAPAHASTGIGAWAIRDGAAPLVGTVLQWARAAGANRSETFIYNDFDRSSKYLALLHWLQDHHQLPDVIGMQSHMHGANWRPKDVWAITQHLAEFGLPIHFTETTVVSGDHRTGMKATGPPATDWKTTAEGEKLQAEYVVQFYSILFSHPSVRAITWWDFTDRGAWMGAPAGLLREDMSPKPAYDALMNLVHHDWWTQEQLTSDSDGRCQCRAFCGQYTLAITDRSGHRIEKAVDVPMGSGETPAPVSIEIEAEALK